MNENDRKNGNNKKLSNLKQGNKMTQFSSTKQPTPQAKSIGWMKRREKLNFLEAVSRFMDLDLQEFELLAIDMQENKKNYRVSDAIAYEYAKQVREGKLLREWSDKNVSNATTKVNLKVTSFKEFMEGIEEPK